VVEETLNRNSLLWSNLSKIKRLENMMHVQKEVEKQIRITSYYVKAQVRKKVKCIVYQIIRMPNAQ
jgi:hypothetical protein